VAAEKAVEDEEDKEEEVATVAAAAAYETEDVGGWLLIAAEVTVIEVEFEVEDCFGAVEATTGWQLLEMLIFSLFSVLTEGVLVGFLLVASDCVDAVCLEEASRSGGRGVGKSLLELRTDCWCAEASGRGG